MADEFPEDIIYEIFSRLPVKSLARFRCVCKPWLKYINDPYLKTIHVKQELTPIVLQQPPLPKKNDPCKISFLRAIQGTLTVDQDDPVLEFCCEYSTLQVLGSCNGLTLVSYSYDDTAFNLAFINLLSKQRLNLPPLKIRPYYDDSLFAAGIGFDDSTSTFKTVFVIYKPDIHVAQELLCTMVLDSGTSSWRRIAQIPAYPITGAGVFAHGRLHWMVGSHWWSIDEGTKIVWFDVKKEEFGLTGPPKRKGGSYYIEDRLVDLNGEVGFAYINHRIELWILKEEEWVLHRGFDLYPLLYGIYIGEVLGGWNEEGDVLLSSNRGRLLFVYTPKTGDLRQVGDLGDEYDQVDIRMYRANLFPILKRTKRN